MGRGCVTQLPLPCWSFLQTPGKEHVYRGVDVSRHMASVKTLGPGVARAAAGGSCAPARMSGGLPHVLKPLPAASRIVGYTRCVTH